MSVATGVIAVRVGVVMVAGALCVVDALDLVHLLLLRLLSHFCLICLLFMLGLVLLVLPSSFKVIFLLLLLLLPVVVTTIVCFAVLTVRNFLRRLISSFFSPQSPKRSHPCKAHRSVRQGNPYPVVASTCTP
jgi:hypothetical protein